MNNLFYNVKRFFNYDIKKSSFSIGGNYDPFIISTNIVLELHSYYPNNKLNREQYDDSIIIESFKKNNNLLFSILLEKTKDNFIKEINIMSYGSFNTENLVNHILNVFDIQNFESLENDIILSNEERYMEVYYERECIDGLYHDVYTLTTLMKG